MLMEPFSYSFQEELFSAEIMGPILAFSPFEPPPVLQQSAFESYISREIECTSECSMNDIIEGNYNSGNNIHKRLIGMLRKMKKDKKEESRGGPPECSRGFKHMMRERQRREKLSQSYSDLYKVLSSKSKGDKNSIVQSAAMYIRELKGYKDELQKKNDELNAKILGMDGNIDGIKVKFEVANPTSGIDSMIGALRRLKSMDVKAKSFRSDLSSNGLSTLMTIQTNMEACEVEKAIEEALKDTETKSSSPIFSREVNWPHNAHLQNVF